MKPWTVTLLSAWSILIMAGQDITGTIDGTLFPVVKNFEISAIELVPNGIEILGEFDKVRNCEYLHLDAYIADGTVTSKIAIDFRDQETVRLPGDHTFGPWFLKINPDQLQTVDIYAHHNCYAGIETITHIF